MLENVAAKIRNLATPRVLTILLGGAALGIAGAVWLSNAGPGMATECPAKAAAAKAIDDAAGGELAALLPTGTGRGYSDLAFQDETGKAGTLADFAGKPILVNFWATWCIPCREEMPALDAVSARHDPEKFQIVPINLDLGAEGITKAKAFLADENLTNLAVLADPTYDAFERLKTNGVALGLPATLLLDSEGCEIAVLQGPAEWDSDDGAKVIDALIALN